MIETERESMERVSNFVTVGGKLREIGVMGWSVDLAVVIATMRPVEKLRNDFLRRRRAAQQKLRQDHDLQLGERHIQFRMISQNLFRPED